MSSERECAAWFRRKKEAKRLFAALREKWETYGRCAGRIRLEETTEEERRLIGGILGRTLPEETVVFRFSDFEKGLQATRFGPVSMEGVLAGYFGEVPSTRKEKRLREEERQQAFALSVLSAVRDEYGEGAVPFRWLSALFSEKRFGAAKLLREFRRSPDEARVLALRMAKALADVFPADGTETGAQALAVFAAAVSGNPHYLDRGTLPGGLFVDGLSFAFGEKLPESAQAWREVLLKAGIVPDTISSIVHELGLVLLSKDPGSPEARPHPAFEAFRERGEACAVTLENLQEITGALAAGGRVYAVENEMVFTCLAQSLGPLLASHGGGLVCTSGQVRAAGLLLMDLLVRNGTQVWYAGDMDPEGIDIAQRLKRRLGENLVIWRMSAEDYGAALSGEEIAETRLARLSGVSDPVLEETARAVRERRASAYQENILGLLEGDVREWIRRQEQSGEPGDT